MDGLLLNGDDDTSNTPRFLDKQKKFLKDFIFNQDILAKTIN